MEVEIIRKTIKKQNIFTSKLRVAAYVRVSRKIEAQMNSFKEQEIYYKDLINKNVNWQFVGIYSDEGISGGCVEKRKEFQRMIIDALDGKIDLIITKSISRFARNAKDLLEFTRMLKEKNIGVYFEEERIYTLRMESEFLLTVLSSVAQQESETISSHIKLGFKMKRERGEMIGFNSCYGYTFDKKNHTLIVKEDEAKVVKNIYQWYINGYGAIAIKRMLDNLKIKTPTGNDTWSTSTILSILKNEKYLGEVIQGKSITVDAVTHKRRANKGEEDKYYMKNHHEAIISKEDGEKVKEIMNSRNKIERTGRRVLNKFTFSGYFRCGFCGKTYSKKSLYKRKPAWDCIAVLKSGREYCPNSKLMHEEVIRNCFMEAYQLLTANNGIVLEEFIGILKNTIKDNSPSNMKNKYEKEKVDIQKKLSKLVDLYVEEKIDNTVFEKKHMAYQNKIDELDTKIKQLGNYELDSSKVELGIDRIKHEIQLKESKNEVAEFDTELFAGLIDYGIIGGYNEIGKKDPYMIRFICKHGFNNDSRKDITDEKIINNNHIGQDETIYVPILDFVSNQHFFVYENSGTRMEKKLISKVRVRLEIEK